MLMRAIEEPRTMDRWARAFQRIDTEDIRVDGLLSSTVSRDESTHVYLVRGSSGTHYQVAVTEGVDGKIDTRCTCPAGERELPCKHQSSALRFQGWEVEPETSVGS